MQAYFEKRIPLLLGLGVAEPSLHLLSSYVDLLWSANDELNLISRKMTFEELIDNHLIDCLLAFRMFPKDLGSAADFGAGGGLPGVVYATQLPNMRYLLFEKSPKKREFLERAKKLVPNLEIHAEVPTEVSVGVVTARAFKPIDVILELSRDYCKRGGKYFLLKGRREKIDEELTAAAKKFKNLNPQVIALKSPVLEVQRHVVLL